MSARLIALDEGSDIVLDRSMIVIGRHPQCEARLDSLRVSRRHCCMARTEEEVVVRDLGSTNGIRINGRRVESGRLRPGDELSIAHIRYRLEVDGEDSPRTIAGSVADIQREQQRDAPQRDFPRDAPQRDFQRDQPRDAPQRDFQRDQPRDEAPLLVPRKSTPPIPAPHIKSTAPEGEQVLREDDSIVAAVRKKLPAELKDQCQIQIVVRLPREAAAPNPDIDGDNEPACRPD
jgi:hypothetical protein